MLFIPMDKKISCGLWYLQNRCRNSAFTSISDLKFSFLFQFYNITWSSLTGTVGFSGWWDCPYSVRCITFTSYKELANYVPANLTDNPHSFFHVTQEERIFFYIFK